MAAFGISVTLVEPGGFATDWSGPSASRSEPLPDYAEVHEAIAEARKARFGAPGDPAATAAALLRIVDADEPPLRVFFGVDPLPLAKKEYAGRIETWEKWNDVSALAQGHR
ncbi:hypothetical protein BH09ACT5_BH09ACT5_12680 [soil metagenome]